MATIHHCNPVQSAVRITLVIVMISLCASARLICQQHQRLKDGKCEKCPVCSRGQGLTEECGGGGGTDAVCLACTEGEMYSNDQNSARCRPCRQCSVYNRQVKYGCRAVVNAECGACLPNHYEAYTGGSNLSPCHHCSSNQDHPACVIYKASLEQQSTQDSVVTTVEYYIDEESTDDQNWYKVATIVLSMLFGLSILTNGCLVLLFVHIKHQQNHVGSRAARACQKETFARENRGESFAESLQENNNNEDQKLLLQLSTNGDHVVDHLYAVVSDSFSNGQDAPPLQQDDPLPSTSKQGTAPVTSHDPSAIRDMFAEPQTSEVDPPKREAIFITSGEPQRVQPTTAAPTFLPPEALVNLVGMVHDAPALVICSSDEEGGANNANERGSQCFSQASTLPVICCHHGDSNQADAGNCSEDTLDTTSLNEFDCGPNRVQVDFQPNIVAASENTTPLVVSWKKHSDHANQLSDKGGNIRMPAIFVPDQQDIAINASPDLQPQHDVASIQITINNTIGQPVVGNQTLVPVREVPQEDESQDTDTTEVKSVTKPTMFTRSCSLEERACNPYSIPVQESMMEVKV